MSEKGQTVSVGSTGGLGGSAPTADIERAINELLLVRNAIGVSAAEIAEVVYREIGEWTVKAEDYDKLAHAARWLRRSCKDRLPPGHYAKLDEECRAIDALLSPNT